jgi:hypothetical protein
MKQQNERYELEIKYKNDKNELQQQRKIEQEQQNIKFENEKRLQEQKFFENNVFSKYKIPVYKPFNFRI